MLKMPKNVVEPPFAAICEQFCAELPFVCDHILSRSQTFSCSNQDYSQINPTIPCSRK